ncbi:hypothetical protein Dsin_023773 [Dipteronia sinensis]|uniref:Uncharacterized protein n=1 Tax=Dipteronia sinensis TaxID=43782 RepID=A0AAE0A490_9ROSI|nr:hypothetical protein Dsin_023773 [Dipteronia sinensis]
MMFIRNYLSFIGATNEKLYYCIATPKGLYIFNGDDDVNSNDKVPNEKEEGNQPQRMEEGVTNHGVDEKEILAKKYRIRNIDYVHAFCSWVVFMV